MKVRTYFMVLIVMITVLSSCRQKTVSLAELKNYPFDEANGLYKKNESNGVLIEVVMKPTDLILAQEAEGMNYSARKIDSIRSALDNLMYFRFSLSRNGEEVINALSIDNQKFKQGIDYLSSGIAKDLKLVHAGDTTSSESVIYMRGYSVSKSSVVLVAFRKQFEVDDDLTFLFNDTFFNTGLNTFDFDANDINSIPTLIL